jgi:ribosomal protein L24E
MKCEQINDFKSRSQSFASKKAPTFRCLKQTKIVFTTKTFSVFFCLQPIFLFDYFFGFAKFIRYFSFSVTMKTELCVYSGYKIYPSHGKRLVRADGKVILADVYLYSLQVNIFLSKKCERSVFMKRNPRDIPWTVLYRRKHKKVSL